MKRNLLFFIVCMFPVLLSAQKKADGIVGYYYYFEPKEKEYSQVEIYKSGNKYKGKVVWLKEPNTKEGKPKTDIYNQAEELQSRPIMGITIFEGLLYNASKNRWEGEIYDPANGDSFKCVAWFDGGNELKIKGYVGSEWMGLSRIITWKKEDKCRK